MMTLEQVRLALEDRRIVLVSRATGLHYNTIKDVRDGISLNPRHKTVQKLSAYLEGKG